MIRIVGRESLKFQNTSTVIDINMVNHSSLYVCGFIHNLVESLPLQVKSYRIPPLISTTQIEITSDDAESTSVYHILQYLNEVMLVSILGSVDINYVHILEFSFLDLHRFV